MEVGRNKNLGFGYATQIYGHDLNARRVAQGIIKAAKSKGNMV